MASATDKSHSTNVPVNGSGAQQKGQPLLQLALNTDLVSDRLRSLIMKGDYVSGDFTVSHEGTPLFNIDSKSFSLSHRKRVIDCRTNLDLFVITKKPWSRHWQYSAEVPEGSGNKIFETETSTSLFGGSTVYMTFQNAARGGGQEHLTMKIRNRGGDNEVMWKDQSIGIIRRHLFKMRTEYEIAAYPGVDPLLIVVLAIVTEDRRRSKKNGSAGAAAGSGGGGGGGC